jgi:hypothetical protein
LSERLKVCGIPPLAKRYGGERMSGEIVVRKAASTSADAASAVREVFEAIAGPDDALTILYCAATYDLGVLGREIEELFGERPVIACTTAGEITPFGYLEGSLAGVSIGGAGLRAATVLIDGLDELGLDRGDQAARQAMAELRATGVEPSSLNTFGFLLVDGLSMREEALVNALYRNLGPIQLFGGSAGDGTRYGRTFVYHRGTFHTNAALFTLVHSALPFHVFKTEHFVPTEQKMVVTGADPARRTVTEIDAEPAGVAYARAVGLQVSNLTQFIFARHPVVVSVGNTPYVRSIQKMNDDLSLQFACAIDEGIVLTVARGLDMVSNLESAFDAVRARIGEPSLILGCDCILRFLEAQELGLRGRIGEIMMKNNVVGFATYGEQFNSMHVNQTFTGVALGSGRARAGD